MLSGHETADFSSIQNATLIITDHYRANYYLAEFFVQHSTHKIYIEPFDLKKRSKTSFFIAREAKKSHGAVVKVSIEKSGGLIFSKRCLMNTAI